jgi:hypothetical protein
VPSLPAATHGVVPNTAQHNFYQSRSGDVPSLPAATHGVVPNTAQHNFYPEMTATNTNAARKEFATLRAAQRIIIR